MQLILAPLQGTTEFPFRVTWKEHFTGLDGAYTPFIPLITGSKVRPAHLRDALPLFNKNGIPVIPQVIGKRSDAMILMANAFAELGYQEVNWNLGCPSATVAKKQHGSGMLPFPHLIRQFLEKVFPTIPIGLSVKMRAGYHSHDELLPVLEVLNDFPIQKIILHPRLGIDQYNGYPCHQSFALALNNTRHPLVYNGDIIDIKSFTTLKTTFPNQNEWMLGRGVLMNPFLPSLLHGAVFPDQHQKKERLYLFSCNLMHELANTRITENRLLAKLKEYWSYFSRWFLEKQSLWRQLRQSETIKDFNNIVENTFKFSVLKL